MVLLRNVRCSVLAAVLIGSSAAQTLTQGQQLRARGQYREAREVFTGILHNAEQSGADNRTVAGILDNLGLDEFGLGEYGDAENVYNRALSLIRADDLLAFTVETHLAELYMSEQRPEEAGQLLRRATAGFSENGAPSRVVLAQAESDLAVASAMQGKRREAEKLLGKSLALLEEELGPDHPMLASSLNPLAAVLVSDHRYEEAVAPAERSWKILQANSQRVSTPDVAGMMDILAQVYSHTGRLQEAESYAKRATAMAEEVYGPNHPRYGLYLQRYAAVLDAAGHSKEAKAVRKRANTVLAQSERVSAGGQTVNVNALR